MVITWRADGVWGTSVGTPEYYFSTLRYVCYNIQASLEVKSFTRIRLWQNNYIPVLQDPGRLLFWRSFLVLMYVDICIINYYTRLLLIIA